MSAVYDRIGVGYARTRRPDPRIAAQVAAALGDARSVVNVGAGSGSYEPDDRYVIAIEPSSVMIHQRPAGSAPAVQAAAQSLPLADAAVDAALAVLTVHHWPDKARGLRELRRVARDRVVVLSWDFEVWEAFWLVREYFPCVRELDRARAIPLDEIVHGLGGGRSIPVPIPHDCVDGFHGAFWRRPEAYLDPEVRRGISTYAIMDPPLLERGLARLAADLDSGAWRERHADLLERDEIDLGYRLVVSPG